MWTHGRLQLFHALEFYSALGDPRAHGAVDASPPRRRPALGGTIPSRRMICLSPSTVMSSRRAANIRSNAAAGRYEPITNAIAADSSMFRYAGTLRSKMCCDAKRLFPV